MSTPGGPSPGTGRGKGGGGGGGGGGEGGAAKGRQEQLADRAEQLRQASLLAPAGGRDMRAACQVSDMPEIPQGFHFSNEAVNASLQAFLRVNTGVGQILGSNNPGLLRETRTALLTTAFPEEVRLLAEDVVREMFMCLPEPVPESGITSEHINTVVRCITDALMNDAPLTNVGTVIGNLFSSLFYGDNPVRIAAGVVHAGATGYMAWISGLGSVAGLTVESARIVFLGLMAGWGYIVAPDAPPVDQQPRFQGPLPFNVSNAQAYWGQLNVSDSGGFKIIEEIRVMLRDRITDPANQLLCLAELTRRVFDKCVPVGPGFRPFQRFQHLPPGAVGAVGANETYFQLLVNQIHGGAITLLNFFGDLCDMVRKLPYQGVGQMGPRERSIRHYVSNQFAILGGGIYRCVRDQAILRGFNQDQINQIFLKSLLEFMVPPDIREAAEHGYTISVHDQLGILASKIRDVVVRCCGLGNVSENMLAQICRYFRSGLTEDAVLEHVGDDFIDILDVIERAEREAGGDIDSAGGVYGGDSNPQARDQAVDKELAKLQDLGFAKVLTAEEAASLKLSRDKDGVVSMLCTLPDKGTQFLKKQLVGTAITLGSTTHAQIKALLEEAAKPQNLAMPHNYPPDPLVFLVHIHAVLEVCHAACGKEQSREAVIAEIQSHLPRFGQPAAVIKFVRSIIRMSIVWSLSTNPKLFTLAIKTPRVGEPYVVLLVNFDSIQAYWGIGKGGHIERKRGVLEVPLEFLGDCTRGIVESLGTRASGLLGWAKSVMTTRACAVAGGGVVPPPPSEPRILQVSDPAQISSSELFRASPPVMCASSFPAASSFPTASLSQTASLSPGVGAAAGGGMVALPPLENDPLNEQNIDERTRLVEESEALQVQTDIQFCATQLLSEGEDELRQYDAIPIAADADVQLQLIKFTLPGDPPGKGGGAAMAPSTAGGECTSNFLPPIFQQANPAIMASDGNGDGVQIKVDLENTALQRLNAVVDAENQAAQHLIDAAAAESKAADRLNASAEALAGRSPAAAGGGDMDELVSPEVLHPAPPSASAAVAAVAASGGDMASPASPAVRHPAPPAVRHPAPPAVLPPAVLPPAVLPPAGAVVDKPPEKKQKLGGSKSRKTTKRTRRNKGRKSSSKTSKKTRQRRDRRSSRHRRSSRKGRK